MDKPEELATQGRNDEEKKIKPHCNMCWTPLCTNEHIGYNTRK